MSAQRAVLYARVSGDDRQNESRNLIGQLDMCREHARAHGLAVVAELAEDDRGASGAAFELPQLNRVRELAAAGGIDVLVVRELDRLSRNLAKQLFVEEELRRAGVSIEYVLGEYPDTPEGNLMKHIRASVAEFERLKIVERTVRGRRLKVAAGSVMVHGRPPFGYCEVAEGGRTALAIVEPEAATIRRIFEAYAGGMSLRKLQATLTEDGVPTASDARGTGGKRRGFGAWAVSSIARILANETYAGTWHYGKENAAGRHDRSEWQAVSVPPIVERALWERVAQRLVDNIEASPRNVKHEYLLRRRIWCGACGAKLDCQASGRHGYRYYRCPANRRGGRAHACDMLQLPATIADGLAWDWVKGILLEPGNLREAFQVLEMRRAAGSEPQRQRLAELDATLADRGGRLSRLLELYLADDTFPREILDEQRTVIARQIDGLKHEREALQAELAGYQVSGDAIAAAESFAAEIAKELPCAEGDFSFRRWVIERLAVSATRESAELVLRSELGPAARVCVPDNSLSGTQTMSLVARFPLANPRRRALPLSPPVTGDNPAHTDSVENRGPGLSPVTGDRVVTGGDRGGAPGGF